VLELRARPDGSHQAVRGVRVGPEQQVPHFVRHREAEQHRRVGASLRGQPLHAIDEHRRQPALVNRRVHQGVPELQLTARRRRSRQAHEPNGQLRGPGRRVARGRMRRGRVVAAPQPRDIDAGGGQDPGRRTQSNRLIRRRHHPGVVHAHLQARVRDDRFPGRLWRAVGGRLNGTRGRHRQSERHSRYCVSHAATVRRGGKCLNALEVTRGETLVT